MILCKQSLLKNLSKMINKIIMIKLKILKKFKIFKKMLLNLKALQVYTLYI